MIGYLSGKVIKKTSAGLIIKTNGVGYTVKALPQTIAETEENKTAKLYIHTYVREDEIALYGFKNYKQLRMFELLISISGIGPKLAFNIISTTSPDNLRAAVAKTDVSLLTKIPGIGKKSASKIMLELSNRLDINQDLGKMVFSEKDETAIDALVNLGFNRNQARRAIQEAGRAYDKLEDKLRAGLKYLNKQNG